MRVEYAMVTLVAGKSMGVTLNEVHKGGQFSHFSFRKFEIMKEKVGIVAVHGSAIEEIFHVIAVLG